MQDSLWTEVVEQRFFRTAKGSQVGSQGTWAQEREAMEKRYLEEEITLATGQSPSQLDGLPTTPTFLGQSYPPSSLASRQNGQSSDAATKPWQMASTRTQYTSIC